jgi:hypothetical protein
MGSNEVLKRLVEAMVRNKPLFSDERVEAPCRDGVLGYLFSLLHYSNTPILQFYERKDLIL